MAPKYKRAQSGACNFFGWNIILSHILDTILIEWIAQNEILRAEVYLDVDLCWMSIEWSEGGGIRQIG